MSDAVRALSDLASDGKTDPRLVAAVAAELDERLSNLEAANEPAAPAVTETPEV